MKKTRVFFGITALLFLLTTAPLSLANFVRGSFYSALQAPLTLSRNAAQWAADLWFFQRNAEDNRAMKKMLSKVLYERYEHRELLQENARLAGLVGLKTAFPPEVRNKIFARVIGRSPVSWNSAFLIDKGADKGIHTQMLVLSGGSLVGRVIEVGPQTSKVLLITDPNSRIGVLLQRTRHQGILYGTSSGECRMKYLP
ncbi:MAG: rod shape-determining protein MreC, partial [Candidatus Omnitrophota bacterium]